MASIDSIILWGVFVQILRPRFFQIGIHWFGELLQSFLNLNSPFYKPNFYFGKSLKLKTFFCLWDFTGNQFLQFWGRKNCQFERFYKILISFFVNYSFRKLSKFHKVHNQVLELLPICQIKGFLRFSNFSKLISRKIWIAEKFLTFHSVTITEIHSHTFLTKLSWKQRILLKKLISRNIFSVRVRKYQFFHAEKLLESRKQLI